MNWSWEAFERYECVFIHVPKTAGMAVCDCLFGSLVGHHTASEYKGIPSSYFRFAFVRNPFDRLISAYEWYHHPDRNDNDRAFKEKTMDIHPTFSDWVCQELRNWIGIEHFRPQSSWIDEPMHFIGRYEYLEEGVKYVQDVLRTPIKPLKVINASTRQQGYWTQEAVEVVREIYAEDFKRFRY